jgi:hypothetical protein
MLAESVVTAKREELYLLETILHTTYGHSVLPLHSILHVHFYLVLV